MRKQSLSFRSAGAASSRPGSECPESWQSPGPGSRSAPAASQHRLRQETRGGSAAAPARREGAREAAPGSPGTRLRRLAAPAAPALLSRSARPGAARRRRAAREAGAARPLCSCGPPTHPSLRTDAVPSLDPSSPSCGQGARSHLRQPAFPPRSPPPPLHARYLERFVDAEGSTNSAQRLSAAVTSSCPQPRKNQNRTGEGKASNKIQRSRREERENAIHPPWHSGDTEMGRVLHLCQTRPILCREPPIPCPDPRAVLWKGGKAGRNPSPMVTTAVSEGAVSLSCYPIC